MRSQWRCPLLVLSVLLVMAGCHQLWLGPDPKDNSPEAIYDAFWQAFDQNYTGFEARGVDWDSVYTAIRPQINVSTTDMQLLAKMEESIQRLHDGHVFVKAGQLGLVSSYTFIANQNFPGLTQIKDKYVPNLTYISNSMAYGTIRPLVGYIYIGTFANTFGFDELDEVLDQMSEYRAIIIDIRDNNGGNDANGAMIAARFNTQRRPYARIQYRNGPRHTDLSAPEIGYLTTRNKAPFTNPVYLLTNRHVFSTGNTFTMMMRAIPTVTQVGDTTGDGVAGPVIHELPNGWTCGIPWKLESLPNGQAVEGKGMAPHIQTLNDPNTVAQGRDQILEKALSLLKQ